MVQEVVWEGAYTGFDEVDVLPAFVECGCEFGWGFVAVAGSECSECGTDSLVVGGSWCAHAGKTSRHLFTCLPLLVFTSTNKPRFL